MDHFLVYFLCFSMFSNSFFLYLTEKDLKNVINLWMQCKNLFIGRNTQHLPFNNLVQTLLKRAEIHQAPLSKYALLAKFFMWKLPVKG